MKKESCNNTDTFEVEYGCEGCSHYDTASGDCWKGAKFLEENEYGFQKWELSSRKICWV